MRRLSFRIVPIAIAGLIVFFQYCSSEKFTNDAGRTAAVGLSLQQEEQPGVQSYRQILSQVDTIERGPQYDFVRKVAMKLAGATGKTGHEFDWRVTLVRGDQINAFCLPGGKIV